MDNNQVDHPAPIETPKGKSNWSSITYAIIIFAVGFFLGHSLPNDSYTSGNQLASLVHIFIKPSPTATPMPPTPTLSPSLCKRITYPTAGRSEAKDRFLKTYTLRPGDTLLSIAKTQLGDVSRVNELVNLNKAQYPDLSQPSPTLPAGTKLYITPKDFPENTGDLWVAEGLVKASDTGHFVLTISQSPNNGGEDIYTNSNTKFMNGMKAIKRGDCISVVIDYMGNATHNALGIWRQ